MFSPGAILNEKPFYELTMHNPIIPNIEIYIYIETQRSIEEERLKDKLYFFIYVQRNFFVIAHKTMSNI